MNQKCFKNISHCISYDQYGKCSKCEKQYKLSSYKTECYLNYDEEQESGDYSIYIIFIMMVIIFSVVCCCVGANQKKQRNLRNEINQNSFNQVFTNYNRNENLLYSLN